MSCAKGISYFHAKGDGVAHMDDAAQAVAHASTFPEYVKNGVDSSLRVMDAEPSRFPCGEVMPQSRTWSRRRRT
jgi:hypothetical protein